MWQPRMEARRTALANVPLGVFPEATYDQEKIHLHEGDRLFVHTDGLTEASSPSGQEFGDDRLRAVLAEAGDESLFELKNRVLAAVREHTGERELLLQPQLVSRQRCGVEVAFVLGHVARLVAEPRIVERARGPDSLGSSHECLAIERDLWIRLLRLLEAPLQR